MAPKPPAHRDAAPPRGVLQRADSNDDHRRLLPTPALESHVAHFWNVRWSLDEPKVAETLPHPTVHVVFESSDVGQRAEVAGIPRTRFTRELVGRGNAFGIKFRPAMFRALLGADLASISGRVLPIVQVFGAAGDEVARQIFAADQLEARVAVAEAFLEPRLGQVTAELARLRDLVELMMTSRELLRVETAAAMLHVDVRTLQRRFREYVGVSPKWVILRYRLHEAAERLHSSNPPSLAALAAELGYADQAHFARDFARWVGRTPTQFVACGRKA